MAADEPDLVRVKLTFQVESVNTWMCSFFFPVVFILILFCFSSRRRNTRFDCDWSSDVCSSDLPGVAALIDDLRARHGQADPATALEQVVAAVGYAQYLADEGPEGVERLENVQELIAGAAAWAETAEDDGDEAGEGGVATGPTLIERYLTQAALVASADQSTGDPTGVTLMTVHMAKGLEWPVVTLAGLEDGLFPLARSRSEEHTSEL